MTETRRRGKTHYRLAKTHTVCGRPVTIAVKLTPDPRKITCDPCRNSAALDGVLGGFNERGPLA